MSSRNAFGYTTNLQDFIKFDILVVCPTCAKQAVVKLSLDLANKINDEQIKLICVHCGFSKRLSATPPSILSQSKNNNIIGRYYSLGGGVDPYFSVPLWLKVDVEQHTLWLYNYEHLTFLRNYINAKLRERNTNDMRNKSIASRLPRWITSSKNRDLILKKLATLEKSLK